MRAAAAGARVPVQFNRIGSMFCAYFCNQPVHDLTGALQSDRARFARFFHSMLNSGVYLAPSQFEAGFLSTAHTEEDLEHTLKAARQALASLSST